MLCALTVRKLKSGTFEQFRDAFLGDRDEGPPEGWVRFNMLRNSADPDEVICFGFYDGTIDELRQSSSDQGRDQQQSAIAPFVEATSTDGLFEVVEDFAITPSEV